MVDSAHNILFKASFREISHVVQSLGFINHFVEADPSRKNVETVPCATGCGSFTRPRLTISLHDYSLICPLILFNVDERTPIVLGVY